MTPCSQKAQISFKLFHLAGKLLAGRPLACFIFETVLNEKNAFLKSPY